MSEYFVPEMPILTHSICPLTSMDFKNLHVIPPDKNNDIAVCIVTFLRDKLLLKNIKSVLKYQPGVKIYIADQGIYDPLKDVLYKMLESEGHKIIYTGFDCGLSVSRNKLIESVKEPYLFLMDDDLEFLPETDLIKLKEYLEEFPNAGLVGCSMYVNGDIKHYEVDLEIIDNKVYYYDANKKPENKNKEIFFTDMVFNCFLSRKELFEKPIYNNYLKVAEHLDSFLTIKYKTQWNVLASKVPIKNQNVNIHNPIYDKFRQRNIYFFQFYRDLWNIDTIVGMDKKPFYIKTYENQQSTKKVVHITPLINADEVLIEFTDILDEENVPYYLMKKTCLQYIKNYSILDPLYIAFKTSPTLIEKLKHKGYSYNSSRNTFIKGDFTIYQESGIPSKYKIYNEYKGKNFKVPFPVVTYLQNLYKKTPEWKSYGL